MILSTATVYVDWDSFDPGLDCHITIDTDLFIKNGFISDNDFHEWLEDNGWLKCDQDAYCPVCRLELY